MRRPDGAKFGSRHHASAVASTLDVARRAVQCNANPLDARASRDVVMRAAQPKPGRATVPALFRAVAFRDVVPRDLEPFSVEHSLVKHDARSISHVVPTGERQLPRGARVHRAPKPQRLCVEPRVERQGTGRLAGETVPQPVGNRPKRTDDVFTITNGRLLGGAPCVLPGLPLLVPG